MENVAPLAFVGEDPEEKVEPLPGRLFDFPWETLRAIVGGGSAIDVPRLQVFELWEAESFLEGYGFRWDDPIHCAELEGYRTEALKFLDEELINDEPGLTLPVFIREEKDIRRLLLWASDRTKEPEVIARQRWSCVLLRLMHTMTHSESYFNVRFSHDIREQVFLRFEPHLRYTSRGMFLGDNKDMVPLVFFELKHTKPKNSLIMKLLHKPENVAADVFDRIGVRFVTQDRFDALRVVRYLRTRNVFMFANVKPSRSRNTLIDLDWLRGEIGALVADQGIDDTARLALLRERLEALPYAGPPEPSRNPHSSRSYHSIQFTCRQLVRVTNPYTESLVSRIETTRLSQPSLAHLCDNLLRTLRRPNQIRFFFPFEVQIMDHKSHLMSRDGEASHDDYKTRQRDTVKRRILRDLLDPAWVPD